MLYFIYMKTQICSFHFSIHPILFIPPMNTLVCVNIDQGIHWGKTQSCTKWKTEKNYMGFLVTKIWQILKRFSRALSWEQTSYFWRVWHKNHKKEFYCPFQAEFNLIIWFGWKLAKIICSLHYKHYPKMFILHTNVYFSLIISCTYLLYFRVKTCTNYQ